MFISKLSDLMRQKGVNQSELAQATGLTPTTIRKFAKGQFDRLDGDTAGVLIRYFGLTSLSALVEHHAALETAEVHQPPKKATRRRSGIEDARTVAAVR